MKDLWTHKSLGAVCEILNGSTPSRKNTAYWELGSVPWLTLDDLRDQGRRISSTREKISEAALDETSVKLLPEGTVLLCCTASLGEFAITRIPLTTNQQFNGLIIRNRQELLPEFLFYYTATLKKKLLRLSGKTTIDFVPISRLRGVSVPIPPLEEQRRIVAILDAAFTAIAKAKANAEKNLQQSRAVFESYLDDIILRGGPDWESTSIGDCIRFIDYRGKTPTKTLQGLRLITAKNVKMGYLQETPKEFVAPETYDKWMTRGVPKKGDVLFTTEAPLANVAQLDTDEKVVFAQRIIIMQPHNSALDRTFLKYLLLSRPMQRQIHEKGTGATVSGIKASLLRTIEISFPRSLARQKDLASRLDLLENQTTKLQSMYRAKLAAFDSLKESILSRAFMGELTKSTVELERAAG